MKFKQLLFIGAAALALATQALAQAWPAKPIRLVVPFPAGGSTDVVGRVIAQELSMRLGQNVVVDNRGGASGTIGSEAVARMVPDGYTLLLSNVGSQGVGPSLFATVKYDAVKDFTHIAMIGTFPNVMIAHPSVPAKSVAEFVALAKRSPGKLNYATSGNGSTNHFMGELLKYYAGIEMVHVPYKGSGPALTDVVGKQMEFMFDSMPSAAQHIKSGSVIALAVSGAERSQAYPQVPTFKESGFGNIVISNWFGLSAPANTPQEVVQRVNAEMKVILAKPDIVTRLEGLGLTAQVMTPEQFTRFVATDVESWRSAVKNTGIKAD
jgi:tripartite-type tricarboxylate transporter receptor subunit TctC